MSDRITDERLADIDRTGFDLHPFVLVSLLPELMQALKVERAHNKASDKIIEVDVKRIEELKAELDTAELAYNTALGRIAELEAELKDIRAGHTVTVEYNLAPAMREGILRNKLISMGWLPPKEVKDD